MATDCAQQGFLPRQVTDDGTITADWLKVPAFNRTVAGMSNVPWADTSIPATRAFHTAMATYAPGTQLNSASISAWASGKLFEAAYAAAGTPDGVTSSQIANGLYALHNETLGGLAPPLNFQKGHAVVSACGFIVGIEAGAFTEPQGLKLTCVS
jgi:branched-chain amino acid transport system substrate-binding protein